MLIDLLADNRNSGVMQNFAEFCNAQDLADSRSLDLNTNVAAYLKWKDERDEQRSESSEKSATSDRKPKSSEKSMTDEEKSTSFLERSGNNNRGGKNPNGEADVSKPFHALLQTMGKSSYTIDTRHDIEKSFAS
jgi:hypothetical protein